MSNKTKQNNRDIFKTQDLYKNSIKEIVETVRSDEIIHEFNNGNTIDMTHA